MNNIIKEKLNLQNKLGISTSSIIKNSGVSRTQFYAIIKGECIPKLDTATRIANALNSTVEELFYEEKEDGNNG